LTEVSVAGRPLIVKVICASWVHPLIESGPTTDRMYPTKESARRTEATPQRVVPTNASTRVPGGRRRPFRSNVSPDSSVTAGAAPLGVALENCGSNLVPFPRRGHGAAVVL
jgi:hypothetical protein